MPFTLTIVGVSMLELATNLNAASLTLMAGLAGLEEEKEPPPVAEEAVEEEPKKRRGRPKKEALSEPDVNNPEPEPEPEDPDPFGIDEPPALEPELTAEEAKEEALRLLKLVWVTNKDGVNALQKKFGCAKFFDIPEERAHELLEAVQALAGEARQAA